MLYTLNPTIQSNVMLRVLGIVAFAVLTALAARLSIPMQPVPFTLQVMIVLAAGITLGARDGALSQVAYLSAIAANVPLDANGVGAAAFAGPTAGYLLAFPIAAGLVGLLAVRQSVWLRWLASLLGVAVIYAIGTSYLKLSLGISWEAAYQAGIAPFIVLDIAKAGIVAVYGASLHQWWTRQTSA